MIDATREVPGPGLAVWQPARGFRYAADAFWLAGFALEGGAARIVQMDADWSHAPDYLPALQRDLVAVISKYVKIDPTHLKVNVERQDHREVLEVKIELPEVAR